MYKVIKEYPNYAISESGTIINLKTKQIKSQYVGSTGYYMVSFSKCNKSKPNRVHRLLATAFIPNPNNKPHVNHKDGNKLNNCLTNLEWVTHKENMKHAFENGLANNTGVNNGMSKLTPAKVKHIKNSLIAGESQQKIANRMNVSRSCILKIHLGKTWAHIK